MWFRGEVVNGAIDLTAADGTRTAVRLTTLL